MREAIITIDVEALRHRAKTDHVKRLIWGDWSDLGSGRAGIIEMMDIADSHGVGLSFYLDVAEEDLHGSAIGKVGKYILERGHDLQMHLHPNYITERTWSEIGFSTPNSTAPYYGRDRAKAMIIHQVSRFERLFGTRPLSYRGGSFNINAGGLEGLKEAGVLISSNHSFGSYTKRGLKPLSEFENKLFKWENGVVELGVTDIKVGDGYRVFTMPMSMNPSDNYQNILQSLSQNPRDKAPVVMVLHSWSLLSYSGKRFGGSSSSKIKKLSRIIELMKENYTVKSVRQWWNELSTELAVLPLPNDQLE